jgi:hypothetical protein
MSMKKVAQLFLGLVLGTVLGVAALTVFIQLTSPDYYRDSGNPPLVPGIFVGGPAGAVFGLIAGALWPTRRSHG